MEQVLAGELAALGAEVGDVRPGGVAFRASIEGVLRVNLWSRFASRILLRLLQRPYRNEQDLYNTARGIHWPAWFDVRQTIKVETNGVRAPVKSLDFVSLKVKDAICDAFRAACGERPSVDTQRPDQRIHVFLDEREATFYLDASGEALFKRGYRRGAGEAPLRENLAAGILRLAGWSPERPLFDPMCGSGTFLTEAAMIAMDRAPGLGRAFAFERWTGLDRELWQRLRDEAAARVRALLPGLICGRDDDPAVLVHARRHLTALGCAPQVALTEGDALSAEAPAAAGMLVMNPPYGERMGQTDALAAWYPQLGDWLKQRFTGWDAWILTGDLQGIRSIGLAPSRKIPLFNGPIECRLLRYEMVAGARRRPRAGQAVPTPPAPSTANSTHS
ncbi:MAG: class I SAM-dependent RNA methyltransferase [Rhodocyclaceae bacterium]|nr:class I SAM-dependent RNA methyltransferase [Rhodocyclaceae bacterium]